MPDNFASPYSKQPEGGENDNHPHYLRNRLFHLSALVRTQGDENQMNSDTPRTTAEANAICRSGIDWYYSASRMKELSSQLERELAMERELRIMQLAGISTASIQNTEKTIKDRIGRDNPYCTQAYLDVCCAIDREMKLRTELLSARAAIEKMRNVLLDAKPARLEWLNEEAFQDYKKRYEEALAFSVS